MSKSLRGPVQKQAGKIKNIAKNKGSKQERTRHSQVSKFLGEVTTDHVMARINLAEIKKNITALRKEVEKVTIDITGINAALQELDYPISRLEEYLSGNAAEGINDKDACIFIEYMLFKYEMIKSMTQEIY